VKRKTPLERKTPLRAKSPTKRRGRVDGQPMCVIAKCRRARHDGTKRCAFHEADRLFSERVRARGRCEVKSWHPSIRCNGDLQTMHIISRRYRSIRWTFENALCGCAAHHRFYTDRPLEWRRDCEENGIDYAALSDRALYDAIPDVVEVVEQLRAA
jgi:hypothetical protein